MSAGVAAAMLVERARVIAMARVADLEVPVASEQPPVSRVACGQHTVEEIDARANRGDQVFGRAHAHQVARRSRRHARHEMRHDARALLGRLADRKPADRVAIEADTHKLGERFVAQALIHAPLHDAEERIRAWPGAPRALGPAHRQAHGARCLGFARRIRRALVEHHGDVGVQHLLNAHRLLRREKQPIAVDRRGELHALLGDLAQRAEAEHLEAPRVGEDRSAPAHEAVQAAMALDHLEPRSQPEMERVAEHDLRAELAQLGGRHRLDRAVGADRHERGCVHAAVRELEHAAARGAVPVRHGELHRSISIASP